jgi:hypothetical protein
MAQDCIRLGDKNNRRSIKFKAGITMAIISRSPNPIGNQGINPMAIEQRQGIDPRSMISKG